MTTQPIVRSAARNTLERTFFTIVPLWLVLRLLVVLLWPLTSCPAQSARIGMHARFKDRKCIAARVDVALGLLRVVITPSLQFDASPAYRRYENGQLGAVDDCL